MNDFATLVLAADSRSLMSGEQALDSIVATAGRAEGAISKAMADIERSTGIAATGLSALADRAKASAASFGDFDRIATQIDGLNASLDPAFAGMVRYESAFEQLSEALDRGVISQSRFVEILGMAEAAYLGLSSSAETAAAAVSSTMMTIDRAAGVASSGIQKMASESADAFLYFGRLESQVDSLAASIDPIYASSKRYELALEQLNAALDAGVISQRRYNTLVEQAEAAYLKLPKPLNEIGKQSIYAGQNSRMMAMQLSQLGQQASMTGNWVQALAIQLPDLALGFGTFGIMAGVAAGALLTFADGILRSQADAEGLSDVMDDLGGALKAYEQAVQNASLSVGELTDKFGVQAEAAYDVYQVMKQIRELEFAESLRQAQQTMVETLGDMQDAVAGFDDALSFMELSRPEAIRMMQTEIQALANEFDLTVGQARRISEALDDIAAAEGPVEAAEATQELADAIQDAADRGANISPELRDVQKSALQASLDAMQLANALGLGADEAGRMASNMAAAAGGYVSATQQLNQLGDLPGMEELDPFNSTPFQTAREIEQQRRDEERERARASRGSRRRGGGGRPNRFTDEMREAERIYDQTRTAAERYQNELEDLNELHKMGYLDADTYSRAVAKVGEEYRNASEAGQFWNDINEDLKQGILDAIVEGESLADTFENIAKSIAKAALEAALFGSGPLAMGGGKGGGGGIFGGLLGGLFSLFSFDGGGYTGSGSRTGGVDGKGGFLGILHPNETVVDHSRGQGGNTNVHVTFGVSADSNGNLMPFVESVSERKVSEAAPGIVAAANQRVLPTVSQYQTQKAGGDWRE